MPEPDTKPSPDIPGVITPENGRTHAYHAEAHVLSGKLERPFEHEIKPPASTALNNDKRTTHHEETDEDISIRGLVTIKRAISRVSGSPSKKHNGWVTLATSIAEGVNLFEVITADRIVSQVSTDHPPVGYVPRVTFLGTQVNNLRISGIPVEVTFNYGICGSKPADDKSYLDDKEFLTRIKAQTSKIAAASWLPKETHDIYNEQDIKLEAMIKNAEAGKLNDPDTKIVFSVVESVGKDADVTNAGVKKDIETIIPELRTVGHLIQIPEFGIFKLGEVTTWKSLDPSINKPVSHFSIAMFEANLGCVGHGNLTGPTADVNGTTRP